jgi:D-glycero-D-manno-heptose 1,7-bisphosphate phosphatase
MGIDSPRRAVFLDRDGVILKAVVREGRPYPPATAQDAEILPGVEGALCRLAAAGYALIVVTNQPDVARGTQTREALDEIHAWLRRRLPLDDIRVCCHDDRDACGCRKPSPGLLTEAAAEGRIDLASSVMVGDRWRDVEAGRRAGCATVFIDHGYDERRPERPDAVAASLPDAADWILARQ